MTNLGVVILSEAGTDESKDLMRLLDSPGIIRCRVRSEWVRSMLPSG